MYTKVYILPQAQYIYSVHTPLLTMPISPRYSRFTPIHLLSYHPPFQPWLLAREGLRIYIFRSITRGKSFRSCFLLLLNHEKNRGTVRAYPKTISHLYQDGGSNCKITFRAISKKKLPNNISRNRS